jgi:(S)-ureidoglycine aminohydrolase
LMINWDEVPFKAHDKGGRKDFFNRPTSMTKRFEMHTTTLNEGLMSHPAHTHKAAEIIFLVNSQNDEATSQAQETIDGTWHDAKVGDIIFLQSNSLHGIRNSGKGTCTYFAFQFE